MANVQVWAARIVCRAGSPVSQSRPLGTSIARIGSRRRVHPVDDHVQRRSRLAPGAGAQQGVDQPCRAGQLPVEPRGIGLGSHGHDWHASVFEDAVVGPGVTGEIGRIGPEEHADVVASQVEMPRQDEAVAGVVAPAAADDDLAGDAQPAERIGDPAAGVLHQHQAGHAVLFDRQGIEPPGLLAIEGGKRHPDYSVAGAARRAQRGSREARPPGGEHQSQQCPGEQAARLGHHLDVAVLGGLAVDVKADAAAGERRVVGDGVVNKARAIVADVDLEVVALPRNGEIVQPARDPREARVLVKVRVSFR